MLVATWGQPPSAIRRSEAPQSWLGTGGKLAWINGRASLDWTAGAAVPRRLISPTRRRLRSGRFPVGRLRRGCVAAHWSRGTMLRFSSTATRSCFMPKCSINWARVLAAEVLWLAVDCELHLKRFSQLIAARASTRGSVQADQEACLSGLKPQDLISAAARVKPCPSREIRPRCSSSFARPDS